MKRTPRTLAILALILGAGARMAFAQASDAHESHPQRPAAGSNPLLSEGLRGIRVEQTSGPRTLPALPENLPAWLKNRKTNHLFYKGGRYNFDIYQIKPLAYDMNAVAVGHAMAYEDLVTGKAARLETKTFQKIDWVLKHPPKLMPDEANLSPTFGLKYGVLEQVFDWTHVLHAQTLDVLASPKLSQAEKDREIERLWKFYFESVPYAVSPLPLNMDYLYTQPYSRAFRDRYPRVNGLFWGYHWLQGAAYDMLYRVSPEWQKKSYALLGEQYHKTELYRTDRYFMPMFAEVSPTFSARFPHVANAFDNLHMLHDMANDILVSDWMTEQQKDEQIARAIWLVSAAAHKGEKPGDESADRAHDHRFHLGMPGMGMMRGSTPEQMYMQDMGWMSMADCHHCSMPLWEGKDEWRNPTVMADGRSMRVRCALCARDYSAETKGRALLHLPTEDPERMLVVLSDEKGELTPSIPEAVFIERPESHANCEEWSRAFSSRVAFEAYVKAHPEFADARPQTFQEWAQREGGKPDTYVKPKGTVENPYADILPPALRPASGERGEKQ